MLETIKALCALPGASGTEDAVRNYIVSRIIPHTDNIKTDVMGNLIVFKKGAKTPGKSVMLAAHMDEVGVIIAGITDDGYLKFACVGGIDRRVLIGKTVLIGQNAVFGVIGNKAVHLVKKGERDKIPSLDDMYIDIGAKDKADALKQVSLGDTGVFDSDVTLFGDGFIKTKALDDRFGCAVLLKLIEASLPVDCTFVFTVQEEVGTRGALTASFGVAPEIALIVEGTTAADFPAVTGNKKVCAIGKGAVIPFMDGATVYNRELFTLLTQAADENNIPWQTKTYISSGTDASVIQRSRSGVMTAGIAAPVRNLHSPACVASLSDLDAVYKLAELFLDEIGKKY